MGFSLSSFSAERSVVAPTDHTVREPGSSPHSRGHILDGKLLEYSFMRITEAARRLGTSARMLRYREDLGLLPQVRERPVGSRRGAAVPGRGAASGGGAALPAAAGSGAAGSGAAGSGAAGSGAAG